VVLDGFDVNAVAARLPDVTMVALVPTMLRRLLDAGVDLSALRCVLLGGADPGAALLDDAREREVRVVTTYGMSETAGGCVYDGRPLSGVRVDVDTGGLIRLAGPMLFSGYRRDPQRTAAVLDDGWFATSDVGRLARGGRLEVLGRADDVIVTGGENVPAGVVAALLEEHPAVAEAAVVGVADQQWGRRVVAVVAPRDQAPSLEVLRDFVAARAPRHAAPRQLVLVGRLPRLDNGKIDRLAVQALAEAGEAGRRSTP
jgi:O-succinylbenzoic acid--CoA ligase